MCGSFLLWREEPEEGTLDNCAAVAISLYAKAERVLKRYSVRDEIKDTVDQFYRAIAARNLRMVEEIWAHEPYVAVAGRQGDMQRGWPAVARYWQLRFAQLGDTQMQLRLADMSFHAVGDVAWLSGTEVRSIARDGAARSEQLRVTMVLERQSTGWLIVSYHASAPCTQPGLEHQENTAIATSEPPF